jgi:hypothetical protein
MEKKLSVLGIDIATQVFHLVGMDEHGDLPPYNASSRYVRFNAYRLEVR